MGNPGRPEFFCGVSRNNCSGGERRDDGVTQPAVAPVDSFQMKGRISQQLQSITSTVVGHPNLRSHLKPKVCSTKQGSNLGMRLKLHVFIFTFNPNI